MRSAKDTSVIFDFGDHANTKLSLASSIRMTQISLPDELAPLDASAQADLVRRRHVEPIELVDAAIVRIERLNPALNAVITRCSSRRALRRVGRCWRDRFAVCRSF